MLEVSFISSAIFPLLLINPDKLFNLSPINFTVCVPVTSPFTLLIFFAVPLIFSVDNNFPSSFINLSTFSSWIFPLINPPLFTIIFPLKVKAPIESIFPLLFPVKFPRLISLPLITPSLLSKSPVISIPFSLFLSSLTSFWFLFSSFLISSFVNPSDKIYPFTFEVSFISSVIFPLLLINPDKLFNLSPTNFTVCVPVISPLLLLISLAVPLIFSVDNNFPSSFINLSTFSSWIFPLITPPLFTIVFPLKVKAPIESIFPLLFPVKFPRLISLPLITPSLLSKSPVISIPFSLFLSSLTSFWFLFSSFFTSSFVKPSDKI